MVHAYVSLFTDVFWLTVTQYFRKTKGREREQKGDLTKGKPLEVVWEHPCYVKSLLMTEDR